MWNLCWQFNLFAKFVNRCCFRLFILCHIMNLFSHFLTGVQASQSSCVLGKSDSNIPALRAEYLCTFT